MRKLLARGIRWALSDLDRSERLYSRRDIEAIIRDHGTMITREVARIQALQERRRR